MAENRPVMPEEYTTLNTLVDAVEQRRLEMQATELAERRAVLEAVRASIRAPAYECSLQEADVLSERLLATLQEADYQTVGQVLEELAMNPDAILALHGVGPKVLEKLLGTLTELAAALPEPEPEPEPEEEVAAAEESAVADASSEQPVAAAEPADEPEEPAEAEADIAEEPVVQPAHEPVPEDWKEDEPDIDQLLKPEQKKKKQRKKRTVVFDDERGVFITSHAHKRDADQFEWDEEL
jgi:hypothetical protein